MKVQWEVPPLPVQDIEDTMNTALNELRELELQSSSKPAPDVVLDTLEQIRNAPPPASLPPHSPLRSLLLHPSEAASPYRGPGSSSDSLATFRPAVAPRMGVQLRPPILRPKPLVLPRPGTSQPTAPTLQGSLDKTCTMWLLLQSLWNDPHYPCSWSHWSWAKLGISKLLR